MNKEEQRPVIQPSNLIPYDPDNRWLTGADLKRVLEAKEKDNFKSMSDIKRI